MIRTGPGGTRLAVADALAGLAVTVAYVGFARLDGSDGSPVFTGPPWAGWAVAVGAGVPVALRRRWPVPALAAVLAALTAATVLQVTREPWLPAALVLYLVGLRLPVRRSWAAPTTAWVAAGVALHAAGDTSLVPVVWLVTAAGWGAGAAVRTVRERASAAALRSRERERHEVATAERLRIAREMHDVVSHHLSLIAVRAGVANHVAGEHPAEARRALRDIETASRGALTEMRGMLGVLRSDDPATSGTAQATVLTPAPGLAGLDRLVRDATAAGVAASLTLDVADAGPLPAAVEVTVYRIVQEALTNVARHSGATSCTVRVSADGRTALVGVEDDGTGGPAVAVPGHGLTGMRERVAAFGGELTAGPGRGGGYAVAARIPYRAGT